MLLLRKIIAILLAIILPVLIVGFAIFTCFQSIISPKSVTKIITSDQFITKISEEITSNVKEDQKISQSLENTDFKIDEVVESVLKTETVNDVISRYTEDMIDGIINDKNVSLAITDEEKLKILSDLDVIIEEVSKETNTEISDENIADIKTEVENNIDTLSEILPSPQYITEKITVSNEVTVMSTVKTLIDPKVKFYFLSAILIISIIIGILIFHPYKWMSYVGVPFIVGAVGVIFIALSGKAISGIIANDLDGFGKSILDSIMSSITKDILTPGFVFLGIGIALIVGKIILSKKFDLRSKITTDVNIDNDLTKQYN